LAEGARLLSECTVKSRTEGSNPSLSATEERGRYQQYDIGLLYAQSYRNWNDFLIILFPVCVRVLHDFRVIFMTVRYSAVIAEIIFSWLNFSSARALKALPISSLFSVDVS
jgi:hypothetical protein